MNATHVIITTKVNGNMMIPICLKHIIFEFEKIGQSDNPTIMHLSFDKHSNLHVINQMIYREIDNNHS